ncbi:LAQU0S04e02080g1_1 [Lachancea quebecensis]|uniref:LAQU0S04e02080g1_1 n=1 Tax=Lachancea quebecensis TaxID=1654605 RepID=A0A0N7MLB8_9SACH|nr:LAQU0S04e02080g1_1 [Lachancea quebecensis]
MSYNEYAKFVSDEAERISKLPKVQLPPVAGLDPEASHTLATALQHALDLHRKEVFSTHNQDAVLAQIVSKEQASLRDELQRVMTLVGDLPREQVGSDLVDLQSGGDSGFVSLERLLDDIEKLPRVSLIDEEDSEGEPLLREYNALRHALGGKALAIREAQRFLPELMRQTRSWQQLQAAVEDVYGAENADAYFQKYESNVATQAHEACRLAETALKVKGALPPDQVESLRRIVSMLKAMPRNRKGKVD